MRDLLQHKVDVEERTATEGEFIDDVFTWSKKRRNLRCRISPVAAREQIYHMREGVKITHWMYCQSPADVVIEENDRIVFGSRVLHPTGVRNPGEAGNHLVIGLEERK